MKKEIKKKIEKLKRIKKERKKIIEEEKKTEKKIKKLEKQLWAYIIIKYKLFFYSLKPLQLIIKVN